MSRYDVIVAGGGPSGSTAAHLLAKGGASVLVLDKARFPREKPCGGGVTVRAWQQAPVDLAPMVEQVVTKVRFSYRLGGFFDYEYPQPLVYMTQRVRLDDFLLQQAVAAGAELREDCGVREVELTPSGVLVRGEGGDFEARTLIGADGANGVVARGVGLHPVQDPPVALEAQYPYPEGVEPQDWRGVLALELGSMAGGYGWSFPKADHFNVGCGGWHSEGPRLREHLAALRQHYGAGELPQRNLRGHHLPTRDADAPISRGAALLVGDAAGLVDPMSGEGIYSAFVSGRLAADAVGRYLKASEPDLWRYEAAVEREMMPDLRAALLLRDAYHYTPRPCYEVMRRSERLRRSLCRLIIGELTYAGLLSAFGPLQLFLRYWAHRGRAARA